MSKVTKSQVVAEFATGAAGLAGDLLRACRPMLPAPQGRMLRIDELSITSGLERQSPLAAAVMALGPAVAAVGSCISSVGAMTSRDASGLAAVAESVVAVALDALEALDDPGGRDEAAVGFAHRLAHATHLATALAAGPRSPWAAPARGHPARAPSLWPRLLDSLSTRIRVKEHWKDGPGLAAWLHRVQAASVCRDAAAHGMAAHAALVAGRAPSSTERLIRCLTFASLYCGFAMLERPPRSPGRMTAGAGAAPVLRAPVHLGRDAYPFRPAGEGAVALS